MRKNELTCSIPMAQLLSNVPEDSEISSVTIFVGVKGSGVFMGSRMAPNPEEMASMISAFGEAKRSVIEGIIRDHGMEMMVSVMFFLASRDPGTKDLGIDPEELMRSYFMPKRGESD
ncbi:hypothetical protein [Geobacter sp. DSM 9736]|uniref:hypothetical protein n=1 Tax=Geobacter sp. DSM 9736 TaxID=1277350 RepID=UPI000B50BFE1|nr:hypothetical protein [Geobacter sp. DSM 9736]SNB45259.1 hypothetical protein SAMN06269301_0664 [Geobacter sp. DSM 9736]